jgi:hypothetical protein
MSLAQSSFETEISSSPWRGFAPGIWQSLVNVRECIDTSGRLGDRFTDSEQLFGRRTVCNAPTWLL